MKKLATLLFVACTIQTWGQVDVWKKQLDNTSVDTTRARLMYQVAWELKSSDPASSYAYTDSAFSIAESKQLDLLYINCIKLKGILERYKGNNQQSLLFLEQALNLSIDKGNQESTASLLNELGNTWSKQSNFKNAHRYYDYAIRLAEVSGNCKMLMRALSNKGLEYDNQGMFDEALQCYFKALQLELGCDDQEALANTKANLGFVYAKLGNFSEAIKVTNEAYEIYRKLNNTAGIAKTISNSATVNFMKGDLQKALTGYQTSLKMYEDLQDPEGMMADINNTSGVLATMGKFDESMVWMKRAISMGKQYGSTKTITSAYINLSDIYFMMGNLPTALAYGDSGKYMAMQQGSLNFLFHAYNNIYRVSEAMGSYRGAYENYQQYIIVRDSMYSMDIAKTKNELEIKYQVDAQRKQLELLGEQEKVRKLEVQQKNYLIAALAGGLFFFIGLVIIVIVILVSRSQKREAVFARNKAELEQQALRSQMNPHFIFNSLNSIQRLYVEGKTHGANEYMADFSTLMRKILDNSAKNKISLKEELNTLQLYFEMEKLRCGEMLEYEIQVDPEIDQLNTMVPPMVIQPFAENAIWHGILPKKEKGSVKIELKKTNEGLLCNIEDDGVGLSNKTGNHESKGIQLTEQRLLTKVKITDLSPGTSFSFIIQA